MLLIEVEFLMGRVYAAEFRDSARPEWPPHPARLFSAFVAAYHDKNGTEQEREVLLWLEQQNPPQIAAQRAGEPNEVVAFVPTNYANKSGSVHPQQRTKQPRSFAVQGPASPIVHYVWPEADPTLEQTEALKGLASRVASLGRACSFVRVQVLSVDAELAVKPNFVPDDKGKLVLAVAGEGRLDDLERSFRFGRRPEQGAPVRYLNLDGWRNVEEEPQGHFGEMIVLRRLSGIGFPIESTGLLTKHLRAAFLSRAGESGPLSSALSGHDGEHPAAEPHVAFAALPNVGGDYGDGRLMGLAAILPASLKKADRRIALQACAAIESINLGEGLGEWKVEISNFDVTTRTLDPKTWMRAAYRWATVTPILLDRYPKKSISAEELIVMACLRAGFPTPVHCTYGSYAQGETAAVKGVPPVFVFSEKKWAVHAELGFDRRVKGPMLLGAGRFYGMGLLKPLSQRDGVRTE